MEKKNPIDEYLNKKLGMDKSISEEERAKFGELAKQIVTISGADFAEATSEVATRIFLQKGFKGAMEFMIYAADLMHALFDNKDNKDNKEGDN